MANLKSSQQIFNDVFDPDLSALKTTANISLSGVSFNTAGLATSARQDTQTTALNDITTNTTGLATLSKQNVIIDKLNQELLSGIPVLTTGNLFTGLTSGVSDGQGLAAATNLRLMGFSATETAGTPGAAQIVLHHGTSNAGGIITYIKLAASESKAEDIGGDRGIAVANGVFVEKPTGNSQITLFHRTDL